MLQVRKQVRAGMNLTAAAVTLLIFLPSSGRAQDNPGDSDKTTTVGTATVSTQSTLVVREGNGRYQVFAFARGAIRPASIPVGSQVRVLSSPGAERGIRVASGITITGSASTSAGNDEDVVPESVRDLERTIRKQARRFNVGVRGGVALDPELVVAGVQGQVATGFNRNLAIRPSVEFAWGELTTMFAINLEGIYRFRREGRWAPYFGLGPGFNFIHRGLQRQDRNIDFGELDYDSALNILGRSSAP